VSEAGAAGIVSCARTPADDDGKSGTGRPRFVIDPGEKRMMRRVIGAIVIVASVALGGIAIAEDWKLYRYPQDGFAIEFPGKPEPQLTSVDPNAMVRSNQYWVDLGAVAYGVSVTLFLPNVIAARSPEQTLSRSIEGVRGSLQCAVRGQADVPMPGTAAKEVVFDRCAKVSGLVAKQRFFLRADWLYQVMVLGTKPDVENDAGTKRFLESFAMIAVAL
jgi:hypothetical protein